MKKKIKRFIKKWLHGAIRYYTINTCGGDFHTGPYGTDGRYIVAMNEDQYHRYTHQVR